MHNLKRQLNQPKEEEGQEISRADSSAGGKMVRHVLPRIPEDASEDDAQVLRAEIRQYTEPDNGDHGADPDEEVVPVYAEDTPS